MRATEALTGAVIGRCTTAEVFAIRHRAAELDLTPSQYVRFAVLRYHELAGDPGEERAAIARFWRGRSKS